MSLKRRVCPKCFDVFWDGDVHVCKQECPKCGEAKRVASTKPIMLPSFMDWLTFNVVISLPALFLWIVDPNLYPRSTTGYPTMLYLLAYFVKGNASFIFISLWSIPTGVLWVIQKWWIKEEKVCYNCGLHW